MGRKRRRSRGRSGESISAVNPEEFTRLHERLTDYTPIQPLDRIQLETTRDEPIGRILDLITPIGRGQRVLVTSPPKAGKTMLLQRIARAVKTNHEDIHQIALLVDERPEEATDFTRNLPIDVRFSTTDRTPKEHIALAEAVFKEAVERLLDGQDVLILLDSITRLARAYNTTYANSSRTLSGGVTAGALDRPRQLFGTARNLEEGGSLTIIATALVDTGSRMDEVIFQEFKGTGNCEIVLSRKLAERRLFPAVEISTSGTRREEMLLNDIEREKYPVLRRKLADMGEVESLEWMLKRTKQSRTNLELIKGMLN
jgi:transcription termination factor Rho